MAVNPPFRILGIDPGTNILGYGVIEVNGTTLRLVEMNVIRLGAYRDHYEKLQHIFSGIREVIRQFKPAMVAVESPFFGKNVQSMLKLGRAQGVAIAAVMTEGLGVVEYSPRRIKQAVTGKGGATKEQVAAMLAVLLNADTRYVLSDATDAVAAAVCYHFSQGKIPKSAVVKKKGPRARAGGWTDFLKENPGRIVGGNR